MKTISFELPLIGVELLDSLEGLDDVPRYQGASYCDAVRLATYGEDLVLEPGCIEVCKWSPVILGMKEPDPSFEMTLEPTVGRTLAGVRVAQLPDILSSGRTPDVVIVRGRMRDLNALAEAIGGGALQDSYRGRIGASALGEGGRGPGLRAALVKVVNRTLAVLRKSKLFDRFTKWVFKSSAVTGVFDRMIRGALADMSVCRNSTVIPFLEDAGNISFFCTGGIAWGCNPPDFLTSGFPYRMIEKVIDRLDFPGKGRL
jgi:hypothetical protein